MFENAKYLVQTIFTVALYTGICCWLFLNVAYAYSLRGALGFLWFLGVALFPAWIVLYFAAKEDLRRFLIQFLPTNTLLNPKRSRKVIEEMRRKKLEKLEQERLKDRDPYPRR